MGDLFKLLYQFYYIEQGCHLDTWWYPELSRNTQNRIIHDIINKHGQPPGCGKFTNLKNNHIPDWGMRDAKSPYDETGVVK